MRNLIVAIIALGIVPAAAHAADVRVSYLVDATAFKAAVAGTPLTFSLYSDASCNSLVTSQAVVVESVALATAAKGVKVKNGPAPPKATRLEQVLTGVTPPTTSYVTVTGTGIVPIGGPCQLQYATVAGGAPPTPTCAPDAVPSGSVCIDKYEASLWQVPPAATTVIQHIKDGTVTLAELNGVGATQFSLACGSCPPPTGLCVPAIPGTFPPDGNYTSPLYAVSIAGVTPTACISAFQAEAACELSTKRLPTNGEWTLAARGTPRTFTDDLSTTCNVAPAQPFTPVNTGSRSQCVSTAGVFDMFGNVSEWAYDPGTWLRGGNANQGGVDSLLVAVERDATTYTNETAGFRCVR
jgi:hypothetical protein